MCCISTDARDVDYESFENGNLGIERTQWGILQVGCDPDCVGSCIPPGWSQDLFYYSANVHPLHGLFACDPEHRLNWLERVFIEFVTIAFVFCVAGLEYSWVHEGTG